MYVDGRSQSLETIRFALQSLAYPIQIALHSPAAAWMWTRDNFAGRAELQTENAALRERVRTLEIEALRRADLERENSELRRLGTAVADVTERWIPARLLAEETSRGRQRMTVDRGQRDGLFRGQAVVAGGGLIGQTLQVGPFSSEIILLTDPEHSVPVQNVRTGLRTLAVGTGERQALTLPFLPLQTDIRAGDLLVTSGLGGVFPAGYPVAIVRSVTRDGRSPLAQVDARVLAELDRDRLVALVWLREGHTAAPAVAP